MAEISDFYFDVDVLLCVSADKLSMFAVAGLRGYEISKPSLWAGRFLKVIMYPYDLKPLPYGYARVIVSVFFSVLFTDFSNLNPTLFSFRLFENFLIYCCCRLNSFFIQMALPVILSRGFCVLVNAIKTRTNS